MNPPNTILRPLQGGPKAKTYCSRRECMLSSVNLMVCVVPSLWMNCLSLITSSDFLPLVLKKWLLQSCQGAKNIL